VPPGDAPAPPEEGLVEVVPVVLVPAPPPAEGEVLVPPLAGAEDPLAPVPVVVWFVVAPEEVVSVAPAAAGGEELRGRVRGGAERGSSCALTREPPQAATPSAETIPRARARTVRPTRLTALAAEA